MTLNETGGSGSWETPDPIKGLLNQLGRTLLSHKLYAPTNQLRHEMFRDLRNRFEEVLEGRGELHLEVESDRLTVRETPVLSFSEADNTWAFRLYKDGMRRLTFHEGLTGEEIGQLLEVLEGGPPQMGEVNVVDAMWEADFKHISHVAVDGFTELLESATDAPSEESGGGPGSLATRFQDLISQLVGATDEAAPAGREPTPSGHEAIQVHERVAAPLRTLIASAPAEQAKLEAWLETLHQETARELLLRLEELLFYELEDPGTRFQEADFLVLFGRLFREWVLRGHFGVATELITRLQSVAYDVPQVGHLPQAVVSAVGSAAIRELAASHELNDWEPSRAAELAAQHIPMATEELIALSHDELSPSGEHLAGHLLARWAASDPDAFAAVATETPAGVLQVCLALLAERKEGIPQQLVQAALEHPEPEVHKATLLGFDGALDEPLRDRLLLALEGDHGEVRQAALVRLVESGDASIGPYLVNHIRRTGLGALQSEEVSAVVNGLLRLGADRYVPFLRAQLEHLGVFRTSMLVREQPHTPQIDALLRALASGPPAAVELFREARGNARGALRDVCDGIWRELLIEWTPSAGVEAIPPSPFARPPSSPSLPATPAAVPVVTGLPPEADEESLSDPEPELIITSGREGDEDELRDRGHSEPPDEVEP